MIICVIHNGLFLFSWILLTSQNTACTTLGLRFVYREGEALPHNQGAGGGISHCGGDPKPYHVSRRIQALAICCIYCRAVLFIENKQADSIIWTQYSALLRKDTVIKWDI